MNYETGESICSAALNAARLRFRPIVMTALAFIFGCLPLWIATGSGGASRRILGTVVIGGMALSTILGLIFIPVTFSVVEYLSHRFIKGGGHITMDCASEPKKPKGGHKPSNDPSKAEEGKTKNDPVDKAHTEGGQA